MEQIQGYGYFERFYINFSSAQNDDGVSEDYRVSLKQRLFIPTTIENPPTPVELDGAQSPFVLSLSNVEDVFTPMRTATVSISFIDDIDLGELLPKDAFEWRVELTRQSDTKRIFVGYLTAEVYTQPAISGPNIVTVNAASPMTPIGALPMPIEGVGSLTIGGLIQMAIKSTIEQDVNAVYIPAIFSLKNNATISDYTELLSWRFSTGRFIRFDENDNADLSTECDTFSIALDAVCKLLGWSLVDMGDGVLYFVSPAYHGPYMAISAENLTAADVAPEIITPTFDSSLAILPIDTGDTVEYRQGLGGVTITPNVKDATLLMPPLTTGASGWEYSLSEAIATNKYTGDVYKVHVGKVAPSVISKSRFPRYRATIIDGDTPTASWEEVTDGSINPFFDVQAELRKIDVCAESDLDGGSDAKKKWNLEETILLNDFVAYGARPNNYGPYILFHDQPVIRLRGRIGFVVSGYININFSMRAIPIDGFYAGRDGYTLGSRGLPSPISLNPRWYIGLNNIYTIRGFQLGVWGENIEGVVDNRFTVTVSLRLGNVYWNGYAWDGNFSKFKIPMHYDGAEWHPIDSNKVITMPCDGDSGYYTEVYSPRSGEVELLIYRTSRYNPDLEYDEDDGEVFYDGYPIRMEIKDLSLEYMPTLDYVDVNGTDNVFHRDFSRGFNERRDVSLPLHSRINNAEQMSLIFDNDYTAIDKVYRTTSTTAQKPEQFLLDEYQRVYGRAIRRWRRGMWLREVRPIDIYSLPASATSALMITGYTKDFAENTAEVYLTEIELPNIVKYVN